MIPDWDGPAVAKFISRALTEDVGPGDITSQTLFPHPPVISAHFLAKEAGILSGMPLVTRIFEKLDPHAKIEISTAEGQTFSVGSILGRITAKASALLAGERLALNLVQRLSGISTQTALYAALALPFDIKVLDTRKTTPLLRIFEKYAVEMGGGTNHRIGLYDGILVKDNHLKLQPDFKKVMDSFRSKGFSPEQVEIEVTSVEMLKKAMDAGAVWFLLDNMRPSMIRRCIKIKRPDMRYEVSGGVSPRNFTKYLIRGIDSISIGALTHSVKSLDISLEME
jgi:nicotinate-nucleotide pyrophosphorylase (carboxylating)